MKTLILALFVLQFQTVVQADFFKNESLILLNQDIEFLKTKSVATHTAHIFLDRQQYCEINLMGAGEEKLPEKIILQQQFKSIGRYRSSKPMPRVISSSNYYLGKDYLRNPELLTKSGKWVENELGKQCQLLELSVVNIKSNRQIANESIQSLTQVNPSQNVFYQKCAKRMTVLEFSFNTHLQGVKALAQCKFTDSLPSEIKQKLSQVFLISSR